MQFLQDGCKTGKKLHRMQRKKRLIAWIAHGASGCTVCNFFKNIAESTGQIEDCGV